MAMIEICGKKLSNYTEPFIVAEAGINHNGELSKALEMIKVAKDSGADAVKFQTFKADEFCGDKTQMFTYQSQGQMATESMFEMFQRFEFEYDEWKQIKKKCDDENILFLSTPQNRSDLDLLLELELQAIKVGSDDFTNLPLLEDYSTTKLPMIVSCGMSDLAEVYQALDAIGTFEGYPTILLLCTSQYPTPPEDVNLLKLKTLTNTFPDLVLGFSDHTKGSLASSLAVGFGAVFFEKHFTLDNNLAGPDHWFSENPESLKDWVDSIHQSYQMMGDSIVRPTSKELEMRKLARRSIVILKDTKKGDKLTEENIGLRRAGNGLAPVLMKDMLGSFASQDLVEGNLLELKNVK
jgi:N,N'-diacetyllegionaminate synthase